MLKTVKHGSGIRVDPPPPCFYKIPTFSRFFLATALKSHLSQSFWSHMMFFLLFEIEVADKINDVSQLPSLCLFCSPPKSESECVLSGWKRRKPGHWLSSPCFRKLWSNFPLFVVNPLPAAGAQFARLFERWGSHIKYETIMVVGMPTVNPLHMRSRLLVVNCLTGVRWKQALSTNLQTQCYRPA